MVKRVSLRSACLSKVQANGAGDALLRHREKSVQSFSQGREPQAVIDKLGVAARKSLLEMRGLAVHGKALQFLVRFHQERTSRSFISATRFHAYEQIGRASCRERV